MYSQKCTFDLQIHELPQRNNAIRDNIENKSIE